MEGKRANDNDTPPNTQSSGGANEVYFPPPPLVSLVTSQETSNPVYEVIGDVSSLTQAQATMVQLCDNIAYGHTPNGN